MKLKSKKCKHLLLLIPILVMIIICIITSALFEQNKQQTYEKTKKIKESEVKVLVSQIDGAIQYLNTPMDDEQRFMLRTAIEEINKETGIYCFLLDKEFNCISNIEKSVKCEFDRDVISSIQSKQCLISSSSSSYGYINTNVNNSELEVYWQEIPTVNSEYYITVTVCLEHIQENDAITICKTMIAILNLILGVSLYIIIFMFNKDDLRK